MTIIYSIIYYQIVYRYQWKAAPSTLPPMSLKNASKMTGSCTCAHTAFTLDTYFSNISMIPAAKSLFLSN